MKVTDIHTHIYIYRYILYITTYIYNNIYIYIYQSPCFELDPRVFYTYFYNHAHRLRLEKLLYLELSRSPNGFFLVLLDPGGGFTSETAARNGRYETVSEVNGHSPMDTSVCSGVTVIQRPWPLAKGNGFILVWGSLAGIISVRPIEDIGPRGSTSKHGG
jgi:hypothetical protein